MDGQKSSLPDALAHLLAETLGVTEPLRSLGSGQEASTFLTSTPDEGDLVVQVRPSQEEVGRERFVFSKLRPLVPLAPVLFTTRFGKATVVVYKRLPGMTLEELSGDDLERSLEPTVEALQSIHATSISETSGFGPFDGSGRGSYGSWHDWLVSVIPVAKNEVRHPDLSSIIERFETTVEGCPEQRQLVHGDFGANNVLWDGDHISGVLDWENALFGDALYDHANVMYWRTWLECMECLAGCLRPRRGGNDSDVLLAYQLRIGLHEMIYNERRLDKEMVSWTANRCRQLMRSR
jgi:hygromycin-B 4-O-kinase